MHSHQIMAKSENRPVIILAQPQLGVNIGMAARAMLNCGLDELRIIDPRDGWPNDDAQAASAGAERVIENAVIFDSLETASADLHKIYATTARPRDMIKRVVTPRQAAAEIIEFQDQELKTAVLFGREAKGLNNDDIALSDIIINVPLNTEYPSLNLAQAVFAVAYEWCVADDNTPPSQLVTPKDGKPANKQELLGLFEHLERELDDCGFLRIKEKRPVMVRNLRNMLGRADLTEQEVRTLRGVIKGLTRPRSPH